jgi:hypothetical protein
MLSKYPKLHEHITLTIPQKLDIIRRLESGKSHNLIVASYNIGLSSVYDVNNQRDQE